MRPILAAAAAAACTASLIALASAQTGSGEPWRESDLIQPQDLAARLTGTRGPKPKIFYIGFAVLYRSKHIPGAVFTGPASKQEGLEALRAALVKLPRNEDLVIYCGCCPVANCPNIRPAFLMLRELGFKNAKLLWLPTSFLKDWLDKGYPYVTGESPNG